MSKHDDNSPRCERCSDPVEEHGEHCPQCAALLLEWEIDEAWFVFLDSLKVGREWVEQIDGALTGWKYAGGEIERETTSKGEVIAYVYALRFIKGEHFIVWGNSSKKPSLRLGKGTGLVGEDFDWSARFSFSAPINIILAAIAAI